MPGAWYACIVCLAFHRLIFCHKVGLGVIFGSALFQVIGFLQGHGHFDGRRPCFVDM